MVFLELGARIRSARLDAGLSQRQLCDGIITRNMLSLIENGSAKPSMDTLRQLAGRLGKTLSFFLEEDAVTSPNQTCIAAGREAFRTGDFESACRILADFQSPDPVFEEEYRLLLGLSELGLARIALEREQIPYAFELLARAESRKSIYWSREPERQRLLLLAQAGESAALIERLLPNDDESLLIRAKSALEQQDLQRAAACLDAARNHGSPEWNLLRGRVFAAEKNWQSAALCLHRAEASLPEACFPLLEQCYREMENYKQAYFYACKQKNQPGI